MSLLTSVFNSSTDGVFIRQAQVFVLPLTESQGGGDEAQAVVFKSSGKQEDFRIAFRIVKNITSLGSPNLMNVSIYNLTTDTRQFLSKTALNMTLQIGYEQGLGKLQKVATGGITSASSVRQGADLKTTIVAYDGQDGLAQATSYKAYKGNTTLNKIVQDLAEDIPGVETSADNIKVESSVFIGPKGRILAGRTVDLLHKLGANFGFSWNIQDGVFKAVKDDYIVGNTYAISNEVSNLISANPRIDNINQVTSIIDIETILDPRINPGDIVDLKSDINPALNNKYQVTFVSHIGDTHGDAWQTNIQCVINQKARELSPTSASSPLNTPAQTN